MIVTGQPQKFFCFFSFCCSIGKNKCVAFLYVQFIKVQDFLRLNFYFFCRRVCFFCIVKGIDKRIIFLCVMNEMLGLFCIKFINRALNVFYRTVIGSCSYEYFRKLMFPCRKRLPVKSCNVLKLSNEVFFFIAGMLASTSLI